jgi:hypothetical protein
LALLGNCCDRPTAGVLWCYHYLRIFDILPRPRAQELTPELRRYRKRDDIQIRAFARITASLARADFAGLGGLRRQLLALLSHKSGFDARLVAFDMLFGHNRNSRKSVTAEALEAAGLLPPCEHSVLHLLRAQPGSAEARELARRILAVRQALPRRQREALERDTCAQMSSLDQAEGPSARVIETLCALDAAVNRGRPEGRQLRLVRAMHELDAGPNNLWRPQYTLHGKFTFATFRKRYAIGLICSLFVAATDVAVHLLLPDTAEEVAGPHRGSPGAAKRKRLGAEAGRAAKRARVSGSTGSVGRSVSLDDGPSA